VTGDQTTLLPTDPAVGTVGGDTAGARTNTDGNLVVVQQHVLATVDHACGNIFQRLYHLIRTARAGGNHALPALEESVRELQALLELFVDYVAPMAIEIRPLRTADVSASFRHHLDEALGIGRVVVVDVEVTGNVAVDPARLARVFHLLAQSLHEPAGHGGSHAVCAVVAGAGHFEIVIEDVTPVKTPAAELRWALAEKLVDLQGGELRRVVTAETERWMLRLPVMAV
jgi:hypothetical protein